MVGDASVAARSGTSWSCPADIDLRHLRQEVPSLSRVVVLAQGLKIPVVQLDLQRGAVLVQVVE
jgi:hypothetical protein